MSKRTCLCHQRVTTSAYSPFTATSHTKQSTICNQKCRQFLSFQHLCHQLPVTLRWRQLYPPTAALLMPRVYIAIRKYLHMYVLVHTHICSELLGALANHSSCYHIGSTPFLFVDLTTKRKWSGELNSFDFEKMSTLISNR